MFSPQIKGSCSHDKNPGVLSVWFSSLRRRPKNEKNASQNKKLQKSCIDLSETSKFYTSIDEHGGGGGARASSKEQLLQCGGSECPHTPHSFNKATSLPPVDVSSPSHDSSTASSSISSSLTDRSGGGLCSNCCQFSTLSKHSEIKLINNKDEVRLLAKTKPNGDKIYAFRNRENIKKVTTTTITRTTVINKQNRIGFIYASGEDAMSSSSSASPTPTHLPELRQLLAQSGPPATTTTTKKTLNTGNNTQSTQSLNTLPSYHRNKISRKELQHNNSTNHEATSQQSASTNTSTSTPDTSAKTRQLNLLDDSTLEFIDSGNGSEIFGDRECTHLSCKHCKCKNQFKSAPELYFQQNKEQIKDELIEVVAEIETHESQDDSKNSSKDRQLTMGRKKFNMDPKKGIEFLVEHQLLRMDQKDVAQFLYKGEGLNKTAIGDYLGERNDFNEQVLKAFVDLHDFTNLILVQALRQFLWSFRLPGEAQKIDRMMECFAQRYCQLNPDIFTNTDTCYVLSFAIIMLNTSLHNPSVKDKPTVEHFITMNRGINNGGDLPRELLISLYDSIKTEPFKIPQDDGNDLMHTFFNPDKEGWLLKQGGRYKSWKRRWFILNDNCLYYFEYTTDKEPRGIIPLENIKVRSVQDRSKPHCFELYATENNIIKACKTDSEGKVVEGKHTVYRMSAASEEEREEWIKCLNQSISTNPFYDILVQRKKKAFANS
ncbi:uncharacterized protein LOC134832685 isoform X1 [Culicoides brevitarsis]|uniref:uncharacterized protein LOC134832685 isoform X1 n=1 Tax=Culicoides brevitarsis TaxID=469753 RepID=UPI00307B49A0